MGFSTYIGSGHLNTEHVYTCYHTVETTKSQLYIYINYYNIKRGPLYYSRVSSTLLDALFVYICT